MEILGIEVKEVSTALMQPVIVQGLYKIWTQFPKNGKRQMLEQMPLFS